MESNEARQTVVIREIVDVDNIRHGNTVEIDGEMITVSRNDISRCQLMGTTIRGQQFRKGITKIIFKVPIKGGFRYEG